jgi:prophage DNA circulation protein
MLSPAVMFIEAAIEGLKNIPQFIADSQKRELASLGALRAQQAGASGLTQDFTAGYVLGLQTARTILATSVALVMKGVDPKDVL